MRAYIPECMCGILIIMLYSVHTCLSSLSVMSHSDSFCRQESLGAQMDAPEEEESDDPMVRTSWRGIVNFFYENN